MYAESPATIGIHFGNNQHTKQTINGIKILLINCLSLG